MALLLLVLLSSLASPATADPLYHLCVNSTGKFISNSTYSSNLNQLISTISSKASATSFATSTTGLVPDRVFGLTMCRGDTDSATCRYCISIAFSDIQQLCPNNMEATIWYDYCQLRYSNQDFFYDPDVTMNNQELLYNTETVSADRLLRFEILTTALMGNISDLAVKNTSRLIATGETALTTADIIYGMVQCTRDLSATDCQTCLQGMVDEITEDPMKGKSGGRVLGMWCDMRYEFYKFYNGTSMLHLSSDQLSPALSPSNVSTPSHRGSSIVGTRIIITLSIAVLIIITSTACMCFWRRRSKMKITREVDVEEITNVDSILFDLSTLKIATMNFSRHNKLGEGGFGSVYKGLLPDGRDIAVKRLSIGSSQGLNELKNELIVVAKLQHKNLVRLYGVCLEEQEMLLVYEYLPNKSLDIILFDPTKSELLNWEKRYKIIEGIARGLLYLQEDSQLKIIHRDLKAKYIVRYRPKSKNFRLWLG